VACLALGWLPSPISMGSLPGSDAPFDETPLQNGGEGSGADVHPGSDGVFSCVVDSDPRFHFDALRWYAALRGVVGVPAHEMVVHAVGGTESDVLDFLRSQGVAVEAIQRFDERSPHCNKISGAIRLAERGVEGSAVLTDTDVVVLEDPRQLNVPPGAMASRIVGAPNPPLRILENMFEAARLQIRGLEPLDWQPGELTVSGHGNGGLYIVPGETLPTLALSWARWARWLMEHVAVLENFPRHIDQPSMALALSELGITPLRLDLRWNFPAQNPARIPANADRPSIIHYHKSVGRGALLKRTGVAAVDEQIDSANEAITQTWHEAFPDIDPGMESGADHRGQQLNDKRTFRTTAVEVLYALGRKGRVTSRRIRRRTASGPSRNLSSSAVVSGEKLDS
jgi:hypothetical protein